MAVGRFKRLILGTGLAGTDNGDDTITLEATGGGVESVKVVGDTEMTGDIEFAAGAGVTLTQDDVDTITISTAASGSGSDDGWLDDTGETWTYASASTFTVSGDLTTKFTKGTKLKLTQTTVKYFYVTGSSHSSGTTTVTVTAGSDYTLANAAISANYHSYAANPQGFPTYFNYTPTLTASVTNPTLGSGATQAGRFTMQGGWVNMRATIVFGSSGVAAGSGDYFVGRPVAAGGGWIGIAWIYDASAPQGRVCSFRNDGIMWPDSATTNAFGHNTPFTPNVNDQIQVSASYDAA